MGRLQRGRGATGETIGGLECLVAALFFFLSLSLSLSAFAITAHSTLSKSPSAAHAPQVLYQSIKRGGYFRQRTYATHPWAFRDAYRPMERMVNEHRNTIVLPTIIEVGQEFVTFLRNPKVVEWSIETHFRFPEVGNKSETKDGWIDEWTVDRCRRLLLPPSLDLLPSSTRI